MSFSPHTSDDRGEMLRAVGAENPADLVAPVPSAARFPELLLPDRLTEMEAADHLFGLAGRSESVSPSRSFLGAGAYPHFVPATVDQIVSRGEFSTAYTPYQPEVAQGTLQTIYEFQTMVAELLGMEIANASMYDGATALAEGALVTVSRRLGRNRVVVTGTVHPHFREVLRTYFLGQEIDLVEVPRPAGRFTLVASDVEPFLDEELACLVVQYPNFFGEIEDIQQLADAAHRAGGSLVVAAYPIALGLLQPPGLLGADVVAAEGQPLGVAQNFGGPFVGLLATHQGLVRQLPGRLAGLTRDTAGKRGFVLTLQTREQHIRREKATSNICTNQGLMATAATVYMATLGAAGFREVAMRCFQNAHHLATLVASRSSYRVVTEGPFFNEFVMRAPVPGARVIEKLQADGILGGLALGRFERALDDHILVCATEVHRRADLEAYAAALPAA